MTRALGHEGVAADCFVSVLSAGRKLEGEELEKVWGAAAVIAATLSALRKRSIGE